MMVKVSGNKRTIAPGIANIPRAKAIPCDPNVEASHHSKPIIAIDSVRYLIQAREKRRDIRLRYVLEP
jgi:hypothetical protein